MSVILKVKKNENKSLRLKEDICNTYSLQMSHSQDIWKTPTNQQRKSRQLFNKLVHNLNEVCINAVDKIQKQNYGYC